MTADKVSTIGQPLTFNRSRSEPLTLDLPMNNNFGLHRRRCIMKKRPKVSGALDQLSRDCICFMYRTNRGCDTGRLETCAFQLSRLKYLFIFNGTGYMFTLSCSVLYLYFRAWKVRFLLLTQGTLSNREVGLNL